MLPIYRCPTVPTIQEPPSEHRPLADSDHVVDIAADQADGPTRETITARATSTKRDHLGRSSYYRSGSPQLHHFLKASDSSPAAEDELRRAGHGHAGPASRRRHSAADLALLRGSSVRANTGLPLDGEVWGPKYLSPSSAENQTRLSSASALPRSAAPHRRASLSTIPQLSQSFKDSKGTDNTLKARNLWQGEEEDEVQITTGGSVLVPGHATDPVAPSEEDWPLGREIGATSGQKTSGEAMRPASLGMFKTLATTSLSSPTAKSSSSSCSSTSSSSRRHSVASSEKTADTDLSINEDRAPGGDETPIAPAPTEHLERLKAPLDRHQSHGPDRDRYYGTPEMPRGPAKLPHISAHNLTPRVPNQTHPKHLPRAEKLPLSGYELLASTISASQRCRANAHPNSASFGPIYKHGSRRNSSASFASAPPCGVADEQDHTTIKPIYRRFEALNHRLLLHLQDELGELEEQLHRLDTTDTQTRRVQNHILPASRRAEFLAGGELQWHKTDILDKIAFKLGQYNHVLTSFTATRDLPAPSPADVDDYRTYFATRQPISEDETRFLDSEEDLVTLAASEGCSSIGGGDFLRSPAHEARPAPQEYLQSLHHSSNNNNNIYTTNDEHVVTPIPGTMHGNSWLVRHNRLSIGSRSSAGGDSATSVSPRSTTRPQSLEPSITPHAPSLSSQKPTTTFFPRRQHSRGMSCGAVQADTSALTTARREAPRQRQPVLYKVPDAALAIAGAVLLPMLGFAVVPGFVSRMAIVFLGGLSAFNSMAALGVWRAFGSRWDIARGIGAYAVVMAAVAGYMC